MKLPIFDFKQEAVLIRPDNSMELVRPAEQYFTLDELYKHIQCDTVEIVRLRGNVRLPAMVLIVDENGKWSNKKFNHFATQIMDSKSDHIVGNAIYCWRKLIN